MQILPRQQRTPEIYGEYWFNSDPLALSAFRGYPILIHFWDFTSLGSVHALPYIHEWHKRYGAEGLVVIGVHTPAFPFGKDPIAVRKAINKLGIKYPVVSDNERMIWGAFGNRVLPTQCLIDRNGYITVVHEGEGPFQDFEHSIQSLLAESGYRSDFPIVMESIREIDKPGAICYKATPELFGGYQRGIIGNVEGYVPESTSHFSDPGYYVDGRIYLGGDWLVTRDYLRLNESDGKEGLLTIPYHAKEVNVVVSPEGEKKFQVFVRQDGKFISKDEKGEDILIDSEGKSYILVTQARLYNIVNNREFGEHRLTLSSRSNGFAFYSAAFVSSLIGGVISYN